MPVMDGLEATRRIKADPGGKETVIVVLTASAMDDDRRTVAQSGADDFLAKPCREDELLEKMRALLNIAYDYEEVSEAEKPSLLPRRRALSAERLGQLPRELVEELRNATLSGNKKLLDKLILKVRETEDAESARALQELADKYEYDALTRLLEEAVPPITERPLARSDIMIVDDNPANLKLLEDMLRQQGHEVRSFPRGRLALAAAAQESAGFDSAGYQHAGDERLRSMRTPEVRRRAFGHPGHFPQRPE